MEAIRYYLGIVSWMGTLPGIAMWFLVHPFPGFWRRLGPWLSYTVMALITAAWMVVAWQFRTPLLGRNLGTNFLTIALGILAAGLGLFITITRKRHLTTAILSGLPEISPKAYPGTLLTEGIYGRMRHPRYVEVTLWVWAYALVANYGTVYLLAGLTPLALFLVVLLEERELRERFGKEWEEYAASVPRFVPRRRSEGA